MSILNNLISGPVSSSADPIVVWQLVDGTQAGQGVILVIDDLIGSGLHIGSGEGIDAREHFSVGHSATISEHLATDVLSNIRERVELHEHVGFELGLGTLDLLVGHIVTETHHVVQSAPHCVLELVVGRHQIDSK